MKGKRKLITMLLAAVVFAALLSGCGGSNSSTDTGEEFVWDELVLSEYLPEPSSAFGYIYADSESYLSIDICQAPDEEYEAYLDACIEMGYTVVTYESDSMYKAYNIAGYFLSLTNYSDDDEEYSIALDATKLDGTFIWPGTGLAALIPAPGSDVGTISIDSSSQFFVYVGEISSDAFTSYINACMEAGFSVNYDKGDDFYDAEDEAGNSLSLDYIEGIQMMTISMYAADDEEEDISEDTSGEDTSDAEDTLTSDDSSSETDSDEFRAFVDEYEAFMDDYCDFMETYYESDDVSGMLADYAQLMADYAEFAAEFDAVDTDSLSADDYQYYLEAQTRVNEKLADLAALME